MSRDKILIIVSGFMFIFGICGGYWIGASRTRYVFENMNFLLTSDRNLETVQNIKALEGLREKRIEEIIKFIEVRVEGGLKYDGIKETTLARAKEYQRKYCKTLCLGIE